jgi:hypothetical protein
MKINNTFRISLALGVAVPALFACSSMEIQTSSDPQANLSKYKTFAWAPQPSRDQTRRHASILDQTVKDSVERDLTKKGLSRAQGSPPDLLISYFGVSRDEMTYGFAPVYGYGGYYSGGYNSTYITREGSLTLQFMDPETKRVVWQGTVADTISEAGPSQEQVSEAVNDLLERFPGESELG